MTDPRAGLRTGAKVVLGGFSSSVELGWRLGYEVYEQDIRKN